MKFSSEDYLIALFVFCERPSDDSLAFPPSVTVAGIDKIDAGIKTHIDHPMTFLFWSGISEVVCAQTDGRNFDA
jgi:hypothetical protein